MTRNSIGLPLSGNTCNNILVRGVNWIGDAVMTMPALSALRRSRPGEKLTLLVRPWVAPLFEKDPNVDEILQYSDEYRGITGKLALAKILRNRRFCSAVLLQNAFDAALLAFLAGIPERIGYGRDARGFLLTRTIPFDSHAQGLHHVDYYMNLLQRAGYEAGKYFPWLFLQLEERLWARHALSAMLRPIVAVNPGAVYGSSKRWHPDRFADVARKVIGEMHGSVLVLGGPSEAGIAEEIRDAVRRASSLKDLSSRLMVTAGRTGLRELAALISESDLLVTNDSGPMHIGYAVGTPVVAIFGSTSPELTGPLGSADIVIRKRTECAPCFARECRKKDLECMDLITPDEVFGAVRKTVASKRAVFFDRDGTLCRDAHYLNRMEDFSLYPEIRSLRRLKDKGFLLVGVSNQSGIARGLVDEDFVKQVNRIFMNDHGFDGFYYCPHHPDDHCSCRKPEPGLLVRARNDFHIDLKRSFVVGDKDIDMMLAKAVGAGAVHVGTGQEETAPHADFIVRDLEGAVNIIEKNA